MRLIDKLIWKELVGPFINGLMMFMLLVFAAGYLFKATDLLVQGIPFGTVFALIMYNLPSVVTQTFPMAMLLAGLLGFGRLSSDRETVAIFAAGVSFPRAVRSVILMGALVSIAAFLWNDYIVPPATTKFYDVQQEAIKHIAKSDKPLSYTLDTKDNKGVEEFVTINGGYDAPTHTLKRVAIVKYSSDPARKGQIEVTVYCDRARFTDQRGLNATYYDGYAVAPMIDKKTGRAESASIIDFRELTTLPGGATVGKGFDEVLNAEITDPNRKSFLALRRELEQDKKQGRLTDSKGKEVDLYGKIALPLASLIFGVVGAALGVNTQRGGGKTVGFGVAIFIVFLYWVFYHAMFVVGKNGGLPPIVASFLADIVGALAGLALSLRASR